MENANNHELKNLKSEIASVMKKIRAKTPDIRALPTEAKGSEVWEVNFKGEATSRVIIYLRSSGCFWAIKTKKIGKTEFLPGCLDCEHSVAGTTLGVAISSSSYLQQFRGEYEKHEFKNIPMLCLYNEGNFFNKKELPLNARRKMLEIIASNPDIKAVVLESLPEFIDESNLKETKEILGDKYVEIGIGLESIDPLVRSLCVNKPFNLKHFEDAANLVNKYFNLLSYVLIKPSFLTEAEALRDSLKTVDYAHKIGSKIVSLEPVSIGVNSMSGALSKLGLYRVAWLWTVLEIAKESHKKGETRIGGYQFSPSYEYHARNCAVCTMTVKKAIREFNSTYNLQFLEELDCICKLEWRKELSKNYQPLTDRISSALTRLKLA